MLRAGIDTATAGGLSAARIEATAVFAYGSASAMTPRIPNQNRWRRVPRLWRPNVRAWERRLTAPPAYANDGRLSTAPQRRYEIDEKPLEIAVTGQNPGEARDPAPE